MKICSALYAAVALTAFAQTAQAQTPVPAATRQDAKPSAAPVVVKDDKPATAPDDKAATPVIVVKDDKPAPPPAEPENTEITSVTVSAERPTNRIDRQVYDVKSDIGSSNGSAADALNNLPSVAVDPDGTVSLRGSQNVQILVDGKPSAMMQGDNRGATLNAIPAEDIESVEVINNPGAQFGNEAGGGPIINIIMKRSRRPGGFGVVNANGGSAGRYNSAVSGSYNEGLFGFQGGVNVRHDDRNSMADTVRDRIDQFTGALTHSTQDSSSAGLNDNAGMNAALNYNIGNKDTIGANLAYSTRTNGAHGADHYVIEDDTAGTLTDYTRGSERDGRSRNSSWGTHWDHKGAIDGETLKIDLRVSASDNSSESRYDYLYAVSPNNTPNSRSVQDNATTVRIADFTGDYERPDQRGVLKLGYKLAQNRNSYDVVYTNIDSLTQAQSLNTLRSNRFDLTESNAAVYGSYQLRLNERWGVLGGLRVEYTDTDIAQLTSQIFATSKYVNYIPSAYASYKVSDDTNLRFSYAHRLRRPGAGDLNPFVVYRDELNVSSGNPGLKPTQTDSFEVGYETRFGKLDANARAYYRKDSDTIVDRKYFISDTVLLTTRDNGGDNHASGLELTASGKLLPTLTLNSSANLARNEQKTLDLTGLETVRSVSSLSGRVRLNWQATEADQIQTSVHAQGKSLAGQGLRQPNATANFSIRHALTPMLNLVLNVTDVFDANKIETITDTPLLRETSIRHYDGRLIYIGLSYRIGGVAPGKGGKRS